ncbi:MAG: OmpA family protein [Terrimicrobiaceae bacterium]|nr:OmpA family protein [Terrimicrobiaceae bacterium]
MNRGARSLDDIIGSSGRGMARWVLPALVLSLGLHFLFWLWASRHPVDRMSEAFYDRIVPRTFQVERVEIDPKLLEPVADPETRPAAAPTAVKLPEETVSFDQMMGEVRATPTAPKLDAAAFAEKPTIEAPSFESTIQTAEAAGVRSLLPDEKSLVEELLKEQPMVTGSTTLDLPNPQNVGGSPETLAASPSGRAPAGFSDLDSLLAQTGPLSSETAPILMPTDLLFDYNSAVLQPGAVASLEKLGELIRRNPNSRFIIEGHTDSFGSDDYNNALSLQRAQSVKDFLTRTMNIPPGSIDARGLGRSRLIAPATGTIEEQQINRRVEIVIRAPATSERP